MSNDYWRNRREVDKIADSVVERLRELHHQHGDFCTECAVTYPCQTMILLANEECGQCHEPITDIFGWRMGICETCIDRRNGA